MKVTLSTFLSGETGYLNSVFDATAEIAVGLGRDRKLLYCVVLSQ